MQSIDALLGQIMVLYCTKILEVNLFAFAYRLFHRDFSPINGAYYTYTSIIAEGQCPEA